MAFIKFHLHQDFPLFVFNMISTDCLFHNMIIFYFGKKIKMNKIRLSVHSLTAAGIYSDLYS